MPFDLLLSPISLGNVTIKNRVMMAPMGVGFAPGENKINDAYVRYFEARAKGGQGLITTPVATVDDTTCGIAEPGAFSLTEEADVEGIRRIADACHRYGAKVATSAAYAVEGGADGIELHAAHGYLINEFISPRANHRTDEYGGSFENRLRFLKEIIEGVKAVLPEARFLVVRLNVFDDVEGGITLEEGKEIARYVESLGVDALSYSAGTYSCKFTLIEPQLFEEGCRTSWLREMK